ncbi:MAG TPA: hypothetical protein VIF15_14835, partial [Polyangiaceae bacterium]
MDKTNKDPSVITRGTPATPPDPDVVWQVFPPLTAARQDPNVLAAKLQTSLRSKNPYVVAQAAEVGGQTFIGIWYAGGGPHNLDRLRLVPAIPYELITLDLIAGEQLA